VEHLNLQIKVECMGEMSEHIWASSFQFPSISFISFPSPFINLIAASAQIAECAEQNGTSGFHNQHTGKLNGQQNFLERFQCRILTAHKAFDLGFYAFQFGQIIAGVQISDAVGDGIFVAVHIESHCIIQTVVEAIEAFLTIRNVVNRFIYDSFPQLLGWWSGGGIHIIGETL
jgi:hypothetical protein